MFRCYYTYILVKLELTILWRFTDDEMSEPSESLVGCRIQKNMQIVLKKGDFIIMGSERFKSNTLCVKDNINYIPTF